MKLLRLAVVSCIAVQTIMQTAAECCPLLTSSRAMPRAVWIIPRYLTGAWPPALRTSPWICNLKTCIIAECIMHDKKAEAART